jgi:hypothetical protein
MGLGAARCPPCSQNAHGETVLVRCAQLMAALATPLKGGIGNWKALARDKARLGRAGAGWVRRLNILSILRDCSPVVQYVQIIEAPVQQHCFSVAWLQR